MCLCIIWSKYTRREFFARHAPSINHTIYCRIPASNFCTFLLDECLCTFQHLMTLIILINCSPLIKTSCFFMNKSCDDIWMFIRLEWLSSWTVSPSSEIHRNSIRNTFHSLRNGRNVVFIVTAIVGSKMKLLESFIDQKSRILCIFAKSVE